MLDFNTEPYNDDFNEDSKFYRILFRPSFAVQARELTQLQTILQNQIQRHGSAIYKQGAMVVPGQVSIDCNAQYVKLTSTYGTATTESFIQSTAGKYITGTSGIKAQIIKVVSATSTDPTTIYVRYITAGTPTGGTAGTQKVFADGEVLTLDANQSVSGSVQAISSSATGTGSLATVQRGIYYVNGFFVLCADPHTTAEQVIVLEKYTNTPDYRVGLNVIETEITPEDDSTLLDNAQTSYNYAAPGAHRYHIDLILTKLPLNSTSDDTFIELLQVKAGQIVRIVNTTQYSELEKTLARRTYDESGNYTVRPFNVDVREARDNNRGTWTAVNVSYLIGDVILVNGKYYTAKNTGTSAGSAPSHTSGSQYDGSGGILWEYTVAPTFNRGISKSGSDDQLAITLDPGKAYVNGYEIEKVATEYVYIDKCRDSTHQVQVVGAFQPATVGNYVLVNSVNSVPFVDTFPTVGLYANFTTTGLATALPGIPPSGVQPGTITTTTSSATVTGTSTKFLTQHVAGSIIRKTDGTAIGTVLSIASDTSMTLTANAASANTGISYISSRLIGTARIRFIEYDSGTVGSTSCQYKLGLFDIKMSSGYDFKRNVKAIYYDNSGGGAVVDFSADIVPVATRLVGSATASSSTTITGTGTSFQTDLIVGDYVSLGGTYRRVVTISSQNSIVVDQATTVTGVTIDRVSTTILEPQNETMIFKLPYYGIKSLRAADGTTNRTTYYAYQKFDGLAGTTFSGNTKVSLSTTAGNLAPYTKVNYIVIDNTTGLIVEPIDSNIGTTTGYLVLSGTSYVGTNRFSVISTVIKTGSSSTEKVKTLNSATVTFTTQAAAQSTLLSLGQADGYRVTSVLMDAGTFTSPNGSYTIDISDYYNFDNGQTATYYGIAKLALKPSYTVPSGPVQVTFEYFTHSGGDYCSVNSYKDVDYKRIPYFGNIYLRDAIDFRPRISTDGVTFETGSNLVPKRGQEVQTDFSYYLARTDKIAIDSKGKFFDIPGTPALNPAEPPDPIDAMVLYTLNLEPYTFSTSAQSVNITKIENKRYTMRDIGKLEARINNIEYYTSLSLLEQQTESLTITDPATGLNRFKNGFMVDNFSGHNVGDTNNIDYYCSIDMEKNELRPFFSMQNVNLIEKVSTDSARTSANYKITGDLITLPYTTSAIITQPYASRLENINPFSIFTFLGNVQLNPPSDTWFEVNRRPDIVQNQEGDFNTIATLAEKAGVLGTVWNAWQTQWTGTSVSSRSVSGSAAGYANVDSNGNFSLNGGWGRVAGSYTVTETTATTIGQSRTGVNTQVVAKIDTQLVNDRVLSTAVIPYIRSRNILIQTTGLKPYTKFYPFFDNVAVDSYCTPATKITFTIYKTDGITADTSSAVGDFDTTSNVGANTTDTARLINGDSNICLNTGDVITGQSSGATAVVVGAEKVLDNSGNVTTRNIYVVNIKGTFTAGESIVGSISLLTGSAITVDTIKTAGSSIYSDINGKVQMLFTIPSTDLVRFRTGQRQFTLTDVSTNDITYTSKGNGQYYAQGILETKQATYMSTRNGVLVQNQVDPQYQTITQTTSRTVGSGSVYYDPLAQTFQIQSKGGAFLTSVDLYFASKDKRIPVHVEIREVVNGAPGKTVLPYSQVTLNPEQVNIASTTVTLPDGTIVPDYNTATRFTFPSPVYVQDLGEYAIVVSSDSNSYKAWISNMGDQIPGSSRMISEQPYAGVLFKSQNGSTWTANQDQDLKFTLNRAVFATNTIGTVQFANDIINKVVLDNNPFETNIGSAKLKVFHPNHGLAVSSYAVISDNDTRNIYGYTPTSGTISVNTGSTGVTGTGTVFRTDIGTLTSGQGAVLYTAESSPRLIGVIASVASGTSGDTTATLVANSAVTYSGAFKIAPAVNGIPVTEIYGQKTVAVVIDNDSYVIATSTTGKKTGYSGGDTVTVIGNIQYNAAHPQAQYQDFADTNTVFYMQTTSGESINDTSNTQSPYTLDGSASAVAINENNYWSTPRLIASVANQSLMATPGKTVTLQAKISTTNDAVSPVIDSNRMGLIAISNTINAPTESNINYGDLDAISLISSSINSSSQTQINITTTGLSTSDSTTKGLLATLQVGKYLEISGSGTSSNNTTAMITAVAADGSSVTVNKALTAVSAGDTLTIKFRNTFIDEISPWGSSTHSKYVTKKVSLASAANTLKIRMSVNSPTASNLAVYYKTSPVGTKNAYSTINYTLAQPDSLFPKVQYGDTPFTDVDYTITGLTAFDAFTVKLVFTSTNSSEVTRVRDLRVVACT
jgi:hypothetical protein